MLPALPLLLLLAGPALAGDAAVYDKAIRRIDTQYLRLDQFDPAFGFEQAGEAAEDAIPWLIVDVADGEIVLRHGDHGQFARVALFDRGRAAGDRGAGISALPEALERLEDAIRAEGSEIPDDVDLPIELLRGVARALDRHSTVLAGQRLESFNERIKGKLSGIGSELGREDGELVVRRVFPGAPAERGGLEPGDVVVRIDGISTRGMTVEQAVDRIRGEEDTTVVLTVSRRVGGAQRELDLTLVRDEVAIPNVTWEMRGSGVGVIAIDHFSEQTERLLRQAAHELTRNGVVALGDPPFGAHGPALRGIVLDLRGNSGGSMLQSAASADLFVDDGIILRTAGRDGKAVPNLVAEMRAHGRDLEPELPDGMDLVPLVVLIDEDSASASEILAGSLALLDRAVLVGERSHGKGTVQKAYDLRRAHAGDDAARMKLTVAEYLLDHDTPVLEGIGLAPDLPVQAVVFTRGGAWLPSPVISEGLPVLEWVDERRGWRELAATPGRRAEQGASKAAGDVDPVTDRGEFLVELGERVVLDAVAGTRLDTLDALEVVADRVRDEEDHRLVRTFGVRGLDWRAADSDYCADGVDEGPECGTPQVEVKVDVVERPVAGSRVEVRAEVRNLGTAPLYRALVRFSASSSRLPWSGVTLPVGFVPPGETALGSATVEIPISLSDREDEVYVTVEADRRPFAAAEPVVLDVVGREPPPLVVSGRLVTPPGPGPSRIELLVENQGMQTLTEVRARVAHPDDDRVELLDTEALRPVLSPTRAERFDIALDVPPDRLKQGTPLDMEVRFDAELFGTVLEVPIKLPVDGSTVRVVAPEVAARVPTSLPLGPWTLRVDAIDDTLVDEVTIWWGRQKLSWHAGDAPELSVSVPIDIEPGTNIATVEVRDDGGAVATRRFAIRGLAADDATADQPPELP